MVKRRASKRIRKTKSRQMKAGGTAEKMLSAVSNELTLMSAGRTPNSKGSRYTQVGAEVTLPRVNVAGKARAKRPGSDLDRGQTIRNENARYIAQSIDQIRNRADVNDIIRVLLREEGIFSSAGNAMVSLASNSGYRLAGYDMTGTMDLDVMGIGYVLMDRLNTHHDYSAGYNDKAGVSSLLATLALDVVSSGGCGVELVLNQDFSPYRLVPVGYSTVEWASDGKGGRYPTQDNGEVELNLPTVFMAEHHRHAGEPYAHSILRPGLASTVYFQEFLEDTRKAVNRVGHSRMTAKLIASKIAETAPEAIKNDDAKMQQYLAEQYVLVQSALESLEPEDAVISFDSVEFDVHDVGGSKSDYTPLLAALGNMQGASLKTPASVTGLRANGGQGLSNAETLVYLQTVDSLRVAVEEVMSRALTLAVRLLGIEGSIQFEFLPINLRPSDELEAYYGTKQKRILERLSFGMINDAEACFELALRPQGMATMLSGTRFYTEKSDTGEGERESSTGRALNPGTPSQSGGDDQ